MIADRVHERLVRALDAAHVDRVAASAWAVRRGAEAVRITLEGEWVRVEAEVLPDGMATQPLRYLSFNDRDGNSQLEMTEARALKCAAHLPVDLFDGELIAWALDRQASQAATLRKYLEDNPRWSWGVGGS